jgi:hypothetical protein
MVGEKVRTAGQASSGVQILLPTMRYSVFALATAALALTRP